MKTIVRWAQRWLLLLFCCALPAHASVVLMGTRVIYPGNAKEKTLHFHNPDAHPNAVQIWLDDGDETATALTGVSPFIAIPQVFRIEAHRGQMVRLILDETNALPQDRESLFYLNFSQLPTPAQEHNNQLLLLFTHRIKVFYRPAVLANTPGHAAEKLQLRWHADGLHLHNPTGHYVIVRQANLLTHQDTPAFAQAQILAPYADTVWAVPDNTHGSRRLRLLWVNDYGADVATELPIA